VYKSKTVGQIVALKTSGRLISLSSFGQQLLQGCLCKSTADSRREMQAKCQQSWLMRVTADDTEFAADVPMPTGKERRSSPATSARRHRHRPPTYRPPPHRRGCPRRYLGVACMPPDTLPLPCVLQYERHFQQPGAGGPTPASTYAHGCQILDVFDVQGGGRLICRSIYTRV